MHLAIKRLLGLQKPKPAPQTPPLPVATPTSFPAQPAPAPKWAAPKGATTKSALQLQLPSKNQPSESKTESPVFILLEPEFEMKPEDLALGISVRSEFAV